jgi:nucleoid-associated protein YgaU
MKAQLINKLLPAEMVTFDFNPEGLMVKRTADMTNGATGVTKGSTKKASPAQLSLSKAYLEGADVKGRAEQLLAWCEPGGGMLGKAIGAALGALSDGRMNLTSKQPTLIFMWGPFLMECVLKSATITYERFDRSGEPTRGSVDIQLSEEPSLLGMLPTNPTSGGLPGRKRHVVSHGESLPLIAAQNYGHPGLWRAIADANGIDDPFRTAPGSVLFLPSVSEISAARS